MLDAKTVTNGPGSSEREQPCHGNPAVADLCLDPIVMWADGWEEMPESPEAAVAKTQAELQRATGR